MYMRNKITIQEFLDFYKRTPKRKNIFYSREEITALALIMCNHTPNGVKSKITEIEKALEEINDPLLVYTFFKLRQHKKV